MASKFDNRLKEFGERWEVDRYLSAAGYLHSSVKPFFVALPKVTIFLLLCDGQLSFGGGNSRTQGVASCWHVAGMHAVSVMPKIIFYACMIGMRRTVQ